MSESRKSDGDFIQLREDVEEESMVLSASDVLPLSDQVNLRRRKPHFDKLEVPEYNGESSGAAHHRSQLSPAGVLGRAEVDPQTAAQANAQEGQVGEERDRRGESGVSYDSQIEETETEMETETETGEEATETEVDTETGEDRDPEDSEDNSLSAGGEAEEEEEEENKTWGHFIYKTTRLALPYLYMIFISLALAYFLYLIETQQREIHGLQSRISTLEGACSRKRGEGLPPKGGISSTRM